VALFSRRDRYGHSQADLERLLLSQPIVPKHDPPTSPKVGFNVSEDYIQFFEDFKEFGVIINDVYFKNKPWRIQEKNTIMLLLGEYDQPEYGRVYDLFYNSAPTGRVEISASFDMSAGAKPYREAQCVRLQVSINRPLALPYEDLTSFLGLISGFTAARNSQEISEHFNVASHSLQAVIWDALRSNDGGVDLNFQANGHPTSYLLARQARKARS
jgi:hypothetical protein